jgi:hypothetical protein
MSKTISKVLGSVLILVGLTGFAVPNLFDMHLTTTHNIIHLISGIVALYFGFGASPRAARSFCLTFGVVYFLLGMLGFVAPNVVASLLHAAETSSTAGNLTSDNLVHLILGGIFLMAGLYSVPQSAPITTERQTQI